MGGVCCSCHYVGEISALRIVTPSTEFVTQPGDGLHVVAPWNKSTLEKGLVLNEKQYIEINNRKTGNQS